jgi:hypothetical protein
MEKERKADKCFMKKKNAISVSGLWRRYTSGHERKE